jgi:hypothetical protein
MSRAVAKEYIEDLSMRTAKIPRTDHARPISIGKPVAVRQTVYVPVVSLHKGAVIGGVAAVVIIVGREIFFADQKRLA